jgi:P-type E1-E2 ATPase
MDFFFKFVVSLQVALAASATCVNLDFEHGSGLLHSYLQLELVPLKEFPFFIREYRQLTAIILFLKWMLRLVELVPVTLLVSMELIRYGQAKVVEWDCGMHSMSKYVSAKVHRSSLMEQLGQVSYILSDKTGTLTQNQFIFRKMSIGGVSYGTNQRDCEDAASREVTNFNMVDSDLNKVIKSHSGNSYELI